MSEQIFISYRRQGGDIAAKLIYETLVNRGFSVFHDNDSIHRGRYDERILDAVENCQDFILILPPNALDRCFDYDDWVRREIRCAINNGKNIIPVLLPGFSFPENLPQDIAIVGNIQGVQFHTGYFDAMMDLLINDRLQSRPDPRLIPPPKVSDDFFAKHGINKRLVVIGAICLTAIIILICVFTLSKFGRQLLCSHNFETAITEPTCTETGLNYSDCTKCARREESVIPALGHNYKTWTVDKEATENEPGAKHALCERCGERKDTTFYLSASEGLEYERVGEHYVLVGIGSCTNEKIVIPPTVDGYPVTEIAPKAFERNTVITEVVIPEGVVTIQRKAFFCCTSLKKVVLPKSLTSIEGYAFVGCAFENITIPENVKTIGSWAFESCSSLKSMTLPKSLAKISLFALCALYKLESINYEGSLEEWREQYRFRIDFLYLNPIFEINCTDGSLTITEHLKNMFK